MKKVCILGCGVTGYLLLHNLQQQGVPPEQVIVIDPTFLGGDMCERWYNVRSNTTWQQLLDAVPWTQGTLPQQFQDLSPTSPCILRHYVDYLREIVKPYMSKCELHSSYAATVVHEEKWFITLKTKTEIVADLLLLALGSEPKQLDLPFPCIPLSIALNPEKLVHHVKKDAHILVFGTAHSAPLIVNHLVNFGAKVTNFYATPKPFYFDRDGEYDGIKQDAAVIADKILSGELPVTMVSTQNLTETIRHTRSVDAVIYAIGFQPRDPFGLKDYDPQTGQILGKPNAWGFGIAYPNQAVDGIHFDVSIPAFQAHIQRQMPNILSQLRIE